MNGGKRWGVELWMEAWNGVVVGVQGKDKGSTCWEARHLCWREYEGMRS